MRDDHRPKQELVHEVVALRKQVADLKEAAVARRRVEDALRTAEEHYRTLIDQVPAGIAQLGRDGELVILNAALAAMLGFASRTQAAEAARTGGLFADDAERRRVLERLGTGAAAELEEVRLQGAGGTRTLRLRGRVAELDGARVYFVIAEPAE